MRHRKSGVKLGRTSSHRKAMFRNMVTSLFKHERINTTDAKAKELRKWADSMITLAKRGDLHARRQALAVIMEKDVVHKLFEEAPKRFGTISGGYTRITKLGLRPGDTAQMSMIELVGPKTEKPKAKTKPEPVKAEEAPKVDEAPKAEEEVKAEEAPAVEEAPVAEETPAAEEAAPAEASEPAAEETSEPEKTEEPAAEPEEKQDK